MIGTWIGPYKIVRELPQDRVGRVYEALDATGKKHYQIKSLRPEVAGEPVLVTRLYTEAQTLALLNHEHIARLFGFIRRDDGIYLVMEFVEGENLKEILRCKGRLEPAVALAFLRQILSAVDFAHRLGVIHGDLKPDNVIVTDFARIKVLDFGVTAILGKPDPATDQIESPCYMSPEQIKGNPVDVRSDVYSLGVLLYELIVGKAPFAAAADLPRVRSLSTPLLPSMLVRNIPNWLDAFLLRALAISPENRFASVAAMSQAMGAAIETKATGVERKSGSLRTLHGVHRLPSRPDILWKSADQNRRLSRALLGHSLKPALRPQQNFARVRHLVAIINAGPWTKGQITGAVAWSQRIFAAIREVPPVASTRCIALLKAITGQAGFIWQLTRRKGSIDPSTFAKRSGISPSGASPSLRRLRETAGGVWRWSNESFKALLETGWKRYAVLAFLLFSVFVEAFIFRGENTLFSPDLSPASITSTSRNGAAQTLLSESTPVVTSIAPRDTQPASERKVAKPSTRPLPTAEEKLNRRAENMHYQALNSRRTVTYRVPGRGLEHDTSRLHDLRINEPEKKNPESSPTQLNVRWEN